MESTTTSSTFDINGTTIQKPNGNIIKPHKDTAPSLFPKLDFIQLVILTVYPITILLGILSNHPADSYFSRKDNFINIYFLKFGWLWTSVAFFAHIASVPQTLAPFVRYITATVWWYLVTQWCFGPPIMDKLFRGTGGICQLAKEEEFPGVFTSALCKASGGAWSGGHDLSGHIFIITHASLFIWWELLPYLSSPNFTRSIAAKINLALLLIWWYSLLNTATYFHTLLEKVTGLIAGVIGWYLVEVLTTFAVDTIGIQS